MLVEISQIKVGPRFGPPNSRQIQLLADSISEVGLLNPITIDSEHNLIAGLHRLKAVKQLGWDSIECVVRDVPLIQAAMAEIDDDLLHKRLTGIDLGDFLLRRKELYEMLYPETRHGGDRKSRTWNENYEAKDSKTHRKKSFAEKTADKLGISKCTIQRKVRIAKYLCPEAKMILRSSDVAVPDKTLLQIIKLDKDGQIILAQMLADGEMNRVRDYLSTVHSLQKQPEQYS